MTTLTRTLQKKSWTIDAALLTALAALLVFSPAEATLVHVVKIVYWHGAAERVSEYAIKFFYAALVCVTGAMAFQRARGLTRER